MPKGKASADEKQYCEEQRLVARIKQQHWLRFLILIAILVQGSSGFAQEAAADTDGPAEYGLSGNWGGRRAELAKRGYQFELILKAEGNARTEGGLKKGEAFLATSEIRMKIDAEKAMRWDGVSFFFSGLGTVGKQPSNYVGDKQVTSNIESNANTFKLYEAWMQHSIVDSSSSVLFGLHDLNTEFYVTDTSGMFLNGSFGVGKDLSQSGVNGPSIFPNTALALRLKTENANHLYTQFGVFEAHAGDVEKPYGTHIRLRDADGTLLLGEYGWSRPEGYNKKGAAKIAFGAWGYTRTSETLERVTNGMLKVSGFLNSTSTELGDSSRKLSESSTAQAAALQETVSAVDQINAMVGKNSDNSAQTRMIAGQSEAAAREGKQVVDQMRDSIAEISSSNTEVMARLEKSNKELFEIVTVISEIGTKTKVINDIVFQTKLLSFNASVEAARAGEHGKGFAVVAEEVGNLAQMSGQASIEISKMLDEGVEKVKSIVEATSREIGALLSEGREKVDHGMVTAQMAGESIEQVLLNIGKVTLMVDEVAVASNEQAQGLEEVAIAMGKLEQVTQANTLVAQQSETTAQDLDTQTEEIESIVNDLFEIVHGEKRRHAEVVVSTSAKIKVAPSKLEAA